MAQPTPPRDPTDLREDRAGSVLLVCNAGDYEFYIDAAHGYSSAALKTTLDLARRYGLKAHDPGMDAPDVLDDGTIRTWLTPTGAVADDLNPLQ